MGHIESIPCKEKEIIFKKKLNSFLILKNTKLKKN